MQTIDSDDGFSVPILSGLPYLGDANVVDQLVTNFAQEVLAVRADFHKGKPEAMDAVGLTEAIAERYGLIFTGKNPGFQAAPWSDRLSGKFRFHTPKPLLARFRDNPEKAFFIYLAQIVIASSTVVESGKLTDKEAAASLRVTLDDVVDRLVGVKP